MRIRDYLNRLSVIMLFCSAYAFDLKAASLSDSILEIPKGSVFELRHELEIPANRNFILLGQNRMNESFNRINQTFNQQKGRYHNHHGYYHYDDYLSQWQDSTGQSYQDCLDRHKRYYSYGGSGSTSSNTIINRGDGNTNVIINNQTDTTPSYGSYQGRNSCIKPEHSIAVLLLNVDESGAGGVFRDGYEFKVKSVQRKYQGDFNIVTIRFDHKVAKGIRIITTQSLESIKIAQLQYRKMGEGFFEGLAAGLAGMTDIGGDHFKIKLASKRYYD